MRTEITLRRVLWGVGAVVHVLISSGLMAAGLSGCAVAAPAGGGAVTQVLRSDKPRPIPASSSEADVGALVDGNTAFALDLYRVLLESERNLLFSPQSLSMVLAMTFAGARGDTERQMAEAAHLLAQDELHSAFNALDRALAGRREREGVSLYMANALWPQQGYEYRDSFLDLLAEHYGAGLQPLDFARSEEARSRINRWTSDQTEQRIEELLPAGAVSGETALVLTSAVYLKAAWLNAFPADGTRDALFSLLDGSQVTVPMMAQTATLGYAERPGAQAVELPYAGGELSMIVLVPAEGAFVSYAEGLDASELEALLGDLWPARVRLRLPKFSYEAGLELKKALAELGMTDAFDMSADFSGMDGTRELFIDDVYHKAFISVDEAGTEAAAASAVVMSRKGPSLVQEVWVNRPFLYLIRDLETGAILFLGHVINPAA